MVFISVNTPTKTKGQCPRGGPGGPGTDDRAGEEHLAGAADDQSARTFSVLSNPECLAEGTAIADLGARFRC
jgi:hypothetical protein